MSEVRSSYPPGSRSNAHAVAVAVEMQAGKQAWKQAGKQAEHPND